MLRAWTKKLGQKHYAEDGESETLCGRPMLGNNYADVKPESEQEECEECVRVIEKNRKMKEIDKPTEIRMEIVLGLKYTEPFENRMMLELELDGIKKELLKAIDLRVIEKLKGSYFGVKLKESDRKITFIYE